MTNKPTNAQGPEQTRLRFLAPVPDDVRRLFRPGGQLDRRDHRAQAAQRLVCDQRMKEPWEKLAKNFNATGAFVYGPKKWGSFFVSAAVDHFSRSLRIDRWNQMTQREMDIWRSRLSKTVAELIDLAEVAPRSPESMGLDFLPFEALQEFVAALGIELEDVPDSGSSDSRKRRRLGQSMRAWELRKAAISSRWSITEVLRMYEKTMLWAGQGDQMLSKPRDAKAGRARFIVGLTRSCRSYYGQPMQELVAISAAVMFEDEAINVRRVRRLTVGK